MLADTAPRARHRVAHRAAPTLAIAICLGLIVPSWAVAQTTTVPDNEELAEDFKALDDPTILKRSVSIQSEWNEYRTKGDELKESLSATWAWRVSSRQDWAVRINLPIEMRFPATSQDDYVSAFGDIKVATGTAFRLNDAWRTGGGVELRTASGTNPSLSDNAWILKEFWTVSWDVTDWLTLSPTVENNHSVAEEPTVSPKRYTELSLPVRLKLPQHWSLSLKYDSKIDYEKDNTWTHSAKAGISKRLDGLPVSLSLSAKKPLERGEKELQVNFGVTYHIGGH